jgi:hypothetical protein
VLDQDSSLASFRRACGIGRSASRVTGTATLSSPCPRSTSSAEVHGQFALRGVDLLISVEPLPPGLDRADHRLPAGMDVDVLHYDFLLAFAAVPVERVEQHRVGAGDLVGLAEVFASALERLFADHGAPVAFHRGIVRRDKLSRDHSLDFVFRSDSNERRHRRTVLTVAGFLLRVSNQSVLSA